ncbi:MAG: hypothetical protein AAF642_11935 [Pseudomonadota bacterium]
MGFRISWITIQTDSPSKFLEEVGFVESDQMDEANEAPFSWAALPNNWYVLFSNDFDFVFNTDLEKSSLLGNIVACVVHEGAMISVAFGYKNGELIWQVGHNSQEGLLHLDSWGSLPEGFEQLRAHYLRMQESEGDSADVDFVFEVPVELARLVSGYRHDQWKFDWGSPSFKVLIAAAND